MEESAKRILKYELPKIDIAAATREFLSKLWIPVEENLPDYGVKVLVWGEASEANPPMGGVYPIITHRIDLSEKQFDWMKRSADKNGFIHTRYVTHWMPLPDKPKQDA